jgi:hypothetical protein
MVKRQFHSLLVQFVAQLVNVSSLDVKLFVRFSGLVWRIFRADERRDLVLNVCA